MPARAAQLCAHTCVYIYVCVFYLVVWLLWCRFVILEHDIAYGCDRSVPHQDCVAIQVCEIEPCRHVSIRRQCSGLVLARLSSFFSLSLTGIGISASGLMKVTRVSRPARAGTTRINVSALFKPKPAMWQAT